MANPFAVAAQVQDGYHASSFEGAKHSRLLFDWAVSAIHPDREIAYASRELRARARDLVRNNAYAAGLVEAFADNIIGGMDETGEGIRLKPQLRSPGREGTPLRDQNWEIERGWREWTRPEYASVDRFDSWLGIQRLAVKTWVTDGEVFIRERRGYRNAFGYALQMLDADLLDETFNVPPNENGIEIRMGVEIDRDGRRLAYHFWERHPTDHGFSGKRERIPADEILHFFVRYRPGQTRGYSLFAPVLTTFKMVDGLAEAELVASRMSAAKMGFITNNTDEAIQAYAVRLSALANQGKDPPKQDLKIAPALLDELLPGQSFEGFDPNHPNDAFEPFLKMMLRGVGRGFSTSYLTFTGDVSDANYSSMRAGLLPERDHWRILQQIWTQHVHSRCYRSWIGMALLTGAVDLPSPVPSDYYAVEWRGRGWKWVDPLKDLLAGELGIALGITSRQREAAALGHDYETVLDETQDDQAWAEEKGVDVRVTQDRGGSSASAMDDEEDDASPNGNGADRATASLRNRVFEQLLVSALENGATHGD